VGFGEAAIKSGAGMSTAFASCIEARTPERAISSAIVIAENFAFDFNNFSIIFPLSIFQFAQNFLFKSLSYEQPLTKLKKI
jgi:hypothetical protein